MNLDLKVKRFFMGITFTANLLYTTPSYPHQCTTNNKVLIVGSSSLKGTSERLPYPNYLKIIKKKCPNAEFTNKSKVGAVSSSIYWKYKHSVKKSNYNAILVNMCVNDIARGNEIKGCKRRVKRITKDAKNKNMKVYMVNNQPWGRYKTWKKGYLKKVKQFNFYLTKLQHEGYIDEIINFYSAIRHHNKKLPHIIDPKYTTDGLHANKKLGQEKLAEIIVKALSK